MTLFDKVKLVAVCPLCGKQHEVVTLAGFRETFANCVCDDCEAKHKAELDEREHAEVKMRRRHQLQSQFAAISRHAQALVREVRRDLLPDAAAFDRVQSWRYGTGEECSLMLCGGTGVGKSRALWALVRRLMVEDGLEVWWQNMDEFAADAIDAARTGREKAWVDSLVRVPVLVLDDLGKERLTPAPEGMLFSVVRQRCDREVPMLVSTQFQPDKLEQRFSLAETGTALVRRLGEYSQMVVFRRKK